MSAVQSPPRMVKQPPTDELLFQVAQQQNENDKPFIIECEAEGEPAPKYVCLYVFGSKQNAVNKQESYDPCRLYMTYSVWNVGGCDRSYLYWEGGTKFGWENIHMED
jgi:hypothetical protein